MYYLVRYLIRLFQGRRAANAVQPADGGATEAAVASQPVPVRTSKHGPSAASRGALALIVHQVGYDLRVSLRNPRARFFTFFFPILLLVVFNGVFGSGTTVVAGDRVSLKVFYVPGILAMSVVVAAYAGLVISISTLRETGVLKRRRATPVPPALLIAGQALSTVAITVVMATILLVIAKVLYGVGIAPAALGAVACAVILGTITFACIAYAVSGLIGSPEAAQPIVQATTMPLWFLSGVLIPTASISAGLRSVGAIFPVEHLADGLHVASVHTSFGAAISVTDVLVLAAWGAGAAAFAAWRFRWLPSTAGG
jgi:ABC-2 type transport system permease protein